MKNSDAAQLVICYVTYPDEAAANLVADYLISNRLVACANTSPINSRYEWAGALQQDKEWVSVYKTRSELVPMLERAVLRLHSYDVPCVVWWPIQATAAYTDWVIEQTRPLFEIRAATASDIPAFLALQSQYLVTNLDKNQRKEGFVTTPFSEAQVLQVIEEEGSLYLALSGSEVVGYAFGASWAYWVQWPMFAHITTLLGQVEIPECMPVDVHNSYQYGPICVDRSMRGQGVGEALFEAVRLHFAARYAVGITFINPVNERSMAFHTRKLGLREVLLFQFGGKNYSMLAF